MENTRNMLLSLIQPGKTILFFDTETTGLPKKYDAPASNVDNWPRLIQLSWIICDENKNIIN